VTVWAVAHTTKLGKDLGLAEKGKKIVQVKQSKDFDAL